MIEVQELTKEYSGKTAVDGISFEVGRGDIVGFLGPNGAGKSTTMRILTGFLSATSGTAKVAGFDVFTESMKARQHIGYMPESVPLYTEMRVKEYLQFRARLKGLDGAEMRKRVGDVMELCGVRDVRRKMIGALSKGYRQRVGLADALVNNPDLLILDEPTNGLDPNQIRQVRGLIKDLSEDRTILISTHILSEVEMTCGRVIVIDQGKIQASGSIDQVMDKMKTGGNLHVEMKGAPEKIQKRFRSLKGVKKVDVEGKDGEWTSFSLRLHGKSDLREEVYRISVEQKWDLRELRKETARLEDAFVDLTNQPLKKK